jgi:DNA-binding response OmpR family regulator
MTSQSADSGPLAGRRVLVIEDEYFLADDIAQKLSELGARVVGPFGDLSEAADVVDRDVAIDAAVVDINLRTEMVFPLARVLRARKVPFVFTSGYDSSSIEAEFQDVRLLGKPLDIAAMARELTNMIKRT